MLFRFFKTIFLNVFLIINPYQLCFGKWVLLKCDDRLIILGNTLTLQHNFFFKRDITLILTIYGHGLRFSQFTVQNSFQFISVQFRPCRLNQWWSMFALWSRSMLLHSFLQTYELLKALCHALRKPTPIMDGSSSAFPKPFFFFLNKSPKIKSRPPHPHNPVPL